MLSTLQVGLICFNGANSIICKIAKISPKKLYNKNTKVHINDRKINSDNTYMLQKPKKINNNIHTSIVNGSKSGNNLNFGAPIFYKRIVERSVAASGYQFVGSDRKCNWLNFERVFSLLCKANCGLFALFKKYIQHEIVRLYLFDTIIKYL